MKNNAPLLLFFASAVVVLLIAIAVSLLMLSSVAMLEESTKRRMAALGEAAAMLATAEELDEFITAADMDKPAYRQLKEKLDAFTRRSEVKFTYYMRLDPATNMMRFVVDNVIEPPEESDGLNSPAVAREEGPDLALSGQRYVMDLGSYSQGWDGLLTAWAPMPRADGSPSGLVAGVDMQDVFLKRIGGQIYTLSVLLVAAMLVVLVVCALCLNLYRRQARQAASASEAKSSFLSRMSHEIRTPMNAIMGLCNMATRAESLDAVREYLGKINFSAQHLRSVIDDVLDISKIESGKMVLENVLVRPAEELEQIATIVGPQAEAKHISFTCGLDPRLPVILRYDKVHMRQVVINLLSNAVKFTPEGGAVSLSVALLELRDHKCNLEWRVKDSGIGIGEESRGKIFEAFEQADASTTRKYGGTGLGLSISRQLVEMMGGKIRVESSLGQGSEFIFNTWVEEAPDDKQPEACPDLRQELDLNGKHVLLVEDYEINQMIAEDLLSGFGAEVDIADNGQLGLDAYQNAPDKYAVIFMDIQMPIMDGYEASRRIRILEKEIGRRIPIIAMTANVFKEDVDRAMGSGMDAHVGKPLDLDQIRAALVKVLGLH